MSNENKKEQYGSIVDEYDKIMQVSNEESMNMTADKK